MLLLDQQTQTNRDEATEEKEEKEKEKEKEEHLKVNPRYGIDWQPNSYFGKRGRFLFHNSAFRTSPFLESD